MKFTRVLTADKPTDADVASWVRWKIADALITAADGTVIFERRGVEVPEAWSINATNIISQKYFRKAGVPSATMPAADVDTGVPEWLQPSVPAPSATFGSETSARQVFHRMAGCWTYWGWHEGLLTTEYDARVFYNELFACLALQYAAPNSPQWFNTGIHWAYGIDGPDSGQWINETVRGLTSQERVYDSYSRPQSHACFIQSVEDDLVNPGGMMDLWTREARLFKYGSGSGSNMSRIRGKGERISGGGHSSGLMSFLRIGDCSAGSIKSGGTTRRAALMRVLDADHPDIEEFIDWKSSEEHKAACIAVGSRVIHDRLAAPIDPGAVLSDIPQSLIDRAMAGVVDWSVYSASSFEGEAIETVSGQNSNNSVRITREFLREVDENREWALRARTTGEVVRHVHARELWRRLCYAAWASGDPGVQFDHSWNDWHTCIADGRINATNPCSEYGFLDETACNLASIRLTKFLPLDDDALAGFEHVVRLWTVVLEISVHMASYPSEAIARNSHLYRTLGLGYADLGGLLMRLALPYASDDGRALAAGLTALMTGVAYRTSAEMAEELGPFPRWEPNAESMRRVIDKHYNHVIDTTMPDGSIYGRSLAAWEAVTRARSFRNAQVTLLAPTGTISFVMDADCTGIEPDFSLVKHKKLAGGGEMRIVNQAVPEALRRLGYGEVRVREVVARLETLGTLSAPVDGVVEPGVMEDHLPIFACAGDISPEDHVRMVAVVQPFLSGGISKTINLPRGATVDDVDRVYRLAERLGVKSVAVYRDGSKLSQPLSAEPAADGERTAPSERIVALERAAERIEFEERLPRGAREYLPWRRERGWTQKIKIGDYGQSVFLHVSEYPDGRPGEVFLELANEGSTLRAMANCLAIAISVGLQRGVPVGEFVDQFVGTKFEPAGYVEGDARIRFASSIADYIGRALGIDYAGRDDLANSPAPLEEAVGRIAEASERADADWRARMTDQVAAYYPSPGSSPAVITGDVCPRCGSLLRRSGTCRTCSNCAYDEGCGGG